MPLMSTLNVSSFSSRSQYEKGVYTSTSASNPNRKSITAFGRLSQVVGVSFIFLVGYLFGMSNIVNIEDNERDIYSYSVSEKNHGRQSISNTLNNLPRALRFVLTTDTKYDTNSYNNNINDRNSKRVVFEKEKCMSNPLIRDKIISPLMYDKVENISAYWYDNLPSFYEESINYATWTRKKKEMHRQNPLEPGGHNKYELFLPLVEGDVCQMKKYGGAPHKDGKPGEDGQKYLCTLPSIEIDLASSKLEGEKILTLDEIQMKMVHGKNDEPCTIFSIGSNGDWSFEEDILKRTKCVVETFDCTVKGAQAVVPEELLNTGRLHLHKLCLGNPLSSVQGSNLQYRDLFYLAKYTNHTRIDVLKMDIEGFEYAVFNNLLDISDKPEQALIHGLKENRKQNQQPPMSKYIEKNDDDAKEGETSTKTETGVEKEKQEDQTKAKNKFIQNKMEGISDYDTKLINAFHSGTKFPRILPNQMAVEFHYQTQFQNEAWWWREKSAAEIVLLAERLYLKGYRSVYAYNNERCPHCKEITLARFNC